MKKYEEIAKVYKKQNKEGYIDGITASLTYADEICAQLDLLPDTGVGTAMINSVSIAFPFIVIAVAEQSKVIAGRKKQIRGIKDAGRRMLKTGVAMAAGAIVFPFTGVIGAVPASFATRKMIEYYKSKYFLATRISERTQRLKELRELTAISPKSLSEPFRLLEGKKD